MTRRTYTPEQEVEIVRRYIAGERMRSLAEVFGGSRGTIRTALNRHGVADRHRAGKPSWRTFTPEKVQEIARLWHEGMSQTAIAERLDTTQTNISRALIEHGIQPVKRYSHHGQPPTSLWYRRGSENPRWRGGRVSIAGGYIVVKLPPDHPMASMRNGHGYVMEHRLVMAEALGRPLRKDETAHHKNGNRADNRPENLELWVRRQPTGQRATDLLAWAEEIISRYGPEREML